MKRILFLVIAFFYFQVVSAQVESPLVDDTVYETENVEVKPDYPGGVEAFYKLFAKNFKSPEEEGVNGKIITTFVIEKDGSITDIKILQDVGYGSGAEVIRVLQLSEKWKPAALNGNKVRVKFQFPISIQSAETKPRKHKR